MAANGTGTNIKMLTQRELQNLVDQINSKFDQLRSDLKDLREELESLKARKPTNANQKG